MEMDFQFISIYGKFVTSQTASFSCADISLVIKNLTVTDLFPQWLFLTSSHVDGSMDVLEEEDIHIFLEIDRDFRVSFYFTECIHF